MNEILYRTAKAYIELLEEIEMTKDAEKLEVMDDKREKLHWKLIEMLNKQGIEFRDREDVVRIANKIVREEM